MTPESPEISEREFWARMRRASLMALAAIERRWPVEGEDTRQDHRRANPPRHQDQRGRR